MDLLMKYLGYENNILVDFYIVNMFYIFVVI